MQSDLPIDLLHWTLAALPLVVLGVLLVWAGRSAALSGAIGAAVAIAVGATAFRADLAPIAVAGGKGLWDALFVLYVVWPALLLYLVAKRGGAFDAIRQGIRRFSNNQLFQVLAIGWVFASFLQGISGFGTPIAVVAPLLLALGVKPLFAVVIPLIGHAWATMFGSVGVTWIATQQVIDMADPQITAWQAALLLWIPNLLAGAAIAWLFGRRQALVQALPLILVISGIHGGGQLALSLWQPIVSNFIAASLALLALYPLSRWRRYSEEVQGIEDRPAMAEDKSAQSQEEEQEPPMGLGLALFPYGVLTAVAVVVLLIPNLEGWLENIGWGPPFPEVTTGYGLDREAKDSYSPITPLTHPGFFLLVACASTWIVYQAKGLLGARADGQDVLWSQLTEKAIPASAAIMAFLVMSKVLDHSGQARVLALGMSQALPPMAYAALASGIGALGGIITSSSTASNMLFAPIQQTVAEAQGLPGPTIIAAQSTGGATGNAAAPANVVLGTSTAGLAGREGEVLRTTLPWVLGTTLATAGATMLIVMLSGSGQ
jgi:lactate permease